MLKNIVSQSVYYTAFKEAALLDDRTWDVEWDRLQSAVQLILVLTCGVYTCFSREVKRAITAFSRIEKLLHILRPRGLLLSRFPAPAR